MDHVFDIIMEINKIDVGSFLKNSLFTVFADRLPIYQNF